jgi:hypothetical protein
VLLTLVLVAAAVAFGVAAPVRAAAPPYLAEMPSAQEVLAKTHGRDRAETWARRYATFERLVAILGELSGPNEFDPTPAQQRIGLEYRGNVARLSSEVTLAEKSTWFDRAWKYEAAGWFNRELMRTYFSPAVRAAYAKVHAGNIDFSKTKLAVEKAAEKAAAEHEKAAAEAANGAEFPLRVKIIFGVLIVLVGLGGGGGYWVYVRYW